MRTHHLGSCDSESKKLRGRCSDASVRTSRRCDGAARITPARRGRAFSNLDRRIAWLSLGMLMTTSCVIPEMQFDNGSQLGTGGLSSGTSGGVNTIVGATGGATTVSPGHTSGGAAPGGGVGYGGGATSTGATASFGTGSAGFTGVGGTLDTGGGAVAGNPAKGGSTATGGAGASGAGASGAGEAGTTATGGNSLGGASGSPASGGLSSSGGAVGVGGLATGGSGTCSGTNIPPTGCPFVPSNPPSCPSSSALVCQGESCCTAIAMPGGTYPMGRSEVSSGSDYYPGIDVSETPEHSAQIAPFALDRYEVVVGRFRQFVQDYDVWRRSHPAIGEGSNPSASNTGWGQSWTLAASDLPATAVELEASIACDSMTQTWTSSIGSDLSEAFPINCVNWYVASAFCIWDLGRLPTEAEWEYAAAGGSQNRLYPWGKVAPNANLANFLGSDNSAKVLAGSKLTTGGAGYFGHADLAGSSSEWVFDWYAAGTYGTTGSPIPCNDCANATAGAARVIRGGGWSYSQDELRSARRNGFPPSLRDDLFGFRCARPVMK